MAEPEHSRKEEAPGHGFAIDVFSGLGLGLLLGIVVALSISPVVSTVVGALASLLAVFLGLEAGEGSQGGALSKLRLNGVRIGSFGLATVLGLMLGFYIRANDPFAGSPDAQLERWKNFPDVLARQMVVYERTGIAPEVMVFGDGTAGGPGDSAAGTKVTVNPDVLAGRRSVLKSGGVSADLCETLGPETSGLTPASLLDRYDYEGGTFAEIARQIRTSRQDPLAMLTLAHMVMCTLPQQETAQ
jgi:hypothetical protein